MRLLVWEVFQKMTSEKFDMVVKFNNQLKDENNENEELVGIEEIEGALKDSVPELYIKETEFLDVVMVELGSDSEEAAKMLRKSNPKTITRIVPINLVVKTDLNEIVTNLKVLASEKMDPGDKFTIKSLQTNLEEESVNIPCDKLVNELKNLKLKFNEKNPKWNIYIEIIGENTGLSIVKNNM
jgi:tRNA acetyltransferase TAN1